MPLTRSFFRSVFFALVWVGGTVDLVGQSQVEDSLLQIVHENKNENAAFRAFKKLGELNEDSGYKTAMSLPAHKAMQNDIRRRETRPG